MSVLDDLSDLLAQNRLALFVGTDLPQAVTGLPSRTDLARDLARRNRLDSPLSLAQVAQRVSRAGNRWSFTAFLRDALDTSGKSPQPFHRRVVALVKAHRIETVVTTAYDNLLELAFQEVGGGLNVVVSGSGLAFTRPGCATLIKLYGDAQQPETLVVTEDDHYGLWRDRNKETLLDEVRAVLRKNAILFLGYNLTDPDFNLLWREVLDRMGRFAMGAYAVWPDLSRDEVRVWEDRQVRVIEMTPLAFLDSLVAGAPVETVERSPSETAKKTLRDVFDEVIELLTPLMQNERQRRALLTRALLGSPVLDAIDYSGSTSTFVVMVINRLADYGEVEPGKPALWALLETSREMMGLEKQRRVDALRDVINR